MTDAPLSRRQFLGGGFLAVLGVAAAPAVLGAGMRPARKWEKEKREAGDTVLRVFNSDKSLALTITRNGVTDIAELSPDTLDMIARELRYR